MRLEKLFKSISVRDGLDAVR